ncbi:Acid-sensing ion channel 1C [Labeo rohita]|uniref:Acid-sensing ion channel 1C n=1 Tax=Labeo rohita TaxID=84645 RepID=A0ABQ8LFW9_LABRO|nr:Acid-sensing ion channel 1C [Labeo rohita]
MEDLSASNQEAINKDSLMDDAKNRSRQRLKMTLPHSVKDATSAFVLKTKVHGLKHAFSPYKSKTQRLFWLLAIFICLGLLFTWSWNRILYLLSYPAVTKIYMVWSHNMTFPAITFCNQNLLRVSSLTKADLYHSGYWMDIMHLNHTVNRQSVSMLKHSRHRERLLHLLDFSDYSPPPDYQLNTSEMIDRLGHQLEDMLLDCRFRGENCTFKNFTPMLDKNVATAIVAEIVICLPIHETSYEAGIKVQIHSQDEPPFIDQLGFGVAPGFQTFVSCQQQLLQYLPPPWGDCRSEPMDSEYFSTYSITACRIDCETRYLLENCNCRMVHMPGTSTVCTPEQYKDCADPALDFLVEKDNDYCVCDTPCNMTRYGKELSMVKIPSKASAKYLAKKFNKTEQYIADNILVLDIFFEALNYEKIEQKKAYEVAGLLGDIGGQMGLFIGASVLTILEIFDYLYEVFKDKVLGHFLRKRRPHRSASDNLSTCDTLRSHSDSLGFAPNVLPSHPAIGNFEEFAC